MERRRGVVYFRFGSTPVIENSEPNFRKEERTFVDFSPNGSASWHRWGNIAERSVILLRGSRMRPYRPKKITTLPGTNTH